MIRFKATTLTDRDDIFMVNKLYRFMVNKLYRGHAPEKDAPQENDES
jgi:hypothetical protein